MQSFSRLDAREAGSDVFYPESVDAVVGQSRTLLFLSYHKDG